jgi:hypothetical protein
LCAAQLIANADNKKVSNAEYTFTGIDRLITSKQPRASSIKCSGTNGSPNASTIESRIGRFVGLPSSRSKSGSFARLPIKITEFSGV